MKKMIAKTTILFSPIKEKVKMEIVHKPSTQPPLFEVEGKRFYVCSMLVEFMRSDTQNYENLAKQLRWHIRSKSRLVERVESNFIENLTYGNNNEWCEWWCKNTFNTNVDFLVDEAFWRQFCKEVMKKNLK